MDAVLFGFVLVGIFVAVVTWKASAVAIRKRRAEDDFAHERRARIKQLLEEGLTYDEADEWWRDIEAGIWSEACHRAGYRGNDKPPAMLSAVY